MDFPAAPAAERQYAEWMDRALDVARRAAAETDVPVGALVVNAEGKVLGQSGNRRELEADPTGHAEIVAIRQAAEELGSWRLDGCTLVVTLEPCLMCAGAAVQSRIQRIVLGAWDRKAGACGGLWDVVRDSRSLHRIEVVGGIREADCSAILSEFFASRRAGNSPPSA